jgi:ribosome-associated toxin RatA of RatAB toxin-antitoxin module
METDASQTRMVYFQFSTRRRTMSSQNIQMIQDEEGTHGVEAHFSVAMPPDSLLAVLWDVSLFGRLYPEIKEYKVLSRTDTTIDLAYRVDAVIKEVRYTLRRELDRSRRTISWKELGGDLKRVRGLWLVEPGQGDGSSQVTYRTFVALGKMIPTRMLAMGAKKKAGEMVERVQQVAPSLAVKT